MLLTTLGYSQSQTEQARLHPLLFVPLAGRKAVFLGDFVDRGPNTPAVLRLVMQMVAAGSAFGVPGNHDIKLLRKLRGKDVQLTHGIAETLEQLDNGTPAFAAVANSSTPCSATTSSMTASLVVAHAGMKEEMQGRGSGRFGTSPFLARPPVKSTIRPACPLQLGRRLSRPGHGRLRPHSIPEPEWLNRTIYIDTGCVFGGKLTALR